MTLSPFHAILHTNTVPSDPDCARIRAFLKEPQQEAMELENTATSLRKQLEVTEQRLEEVKLLISTHEALISPMRRVPVDVLRTIFLHTLPTARNTAMSPIEGPLLLCEVCKDWCDIALSTPRLWASIHVVVPEEEKVAELTDTMSSWMNRSGAVPLRISMRLTRSLHSWNPHWRQRTVTTMPILQLLLSASRRWGDVQLLFTRVEDMALLSNLTPSDVPLLRGIELLNSPAVTTPLGIPQNMLDIPLPFLETPTLRHFTFQGEYAALPLTVAWNHLTTLTLNMPALQFPSTISFPFPFLRQCTSLEAFALTLSGYHLALPEPEAEHTQVVHLPAVTDIVLAIDMRSTQSSGHRIFECMSLPKLRSLELQNTISRHLPELFHPVSGIRSLTMAIDPLTTPVLVSALELLPQIEELCLHGEPYLIPVLPQPLAETISPALAPPIKDGNFLSYLILSESESGTSTTTPLCPDLRRLELTRVYSLSDALLVQFVESRPMLTGLKCTMFRAQQMDVREALGLGLGLGRQEEVGEKGKGKAPLDLVLSYKEPIGRLRYSALEGTELDSAGRVGDGFYNYVGDGIGEIWGE